MSTTPLVSLMDDGEQIITGNDSVIVVDNFASIRGGRTLDVSGFLSKIIPEGHPIILESATGNYKPMPTIEPAANKVATLGTVVGGAAYTNGTYNGVPLLGGTGKGATATIVVAGNVVTAVTPNQPGQDYTVGDVLTADNTNLGGTGSGFSVPVSTVGQVAAAYKALPAGHTYAGVNIATIRTLRPFAGIMVNGTVNYAAAYYPYGPILTAIKAALPLIDFRQD